MEPLGDRVLVKPLEAEDVSIPFRILFTDCCLFSKLLEECCYLQVQQIQVVTLVLEKSILSIKSHLLSSFHV